MQDHCECMFLSFVLFAMVQVSCLGQTPETARTPTSPVSQGNNVCQIKEIWEQKSQNLDRKSKNINRERLNLMLEILSQASRDDVKAEFGRLNTRGDGYGRMTEYDQVLVQAFVDRLISEKNDDELIQLISKRTPRNVGSIPIELFLATRHREKLLVLFKGYENVGNDGAKEDLLSIFSCIFPDFRKSAESDEDFITTSKAWYVKNAERRVNTFYEPCSSWPDRRMFFKEGRFRQENQSLGFETEVDYVSTCPL
jgi:hypothetical protein